MRIGQTKLRRGLKTASGQLREQPQRGRRDGANFLIHSRALNSDLGLDLDSLEGLTLEPDKWAGAGSIRCEDIQWLTMEPNRIVCQARGQQVA